MHINSDINILGGLPDWNLIQIFLLENRQSLKDNGSNHAFTAIKTEKSVRLFQKAIRDTFLNFKIPKLEAIIHPAIKENPASTEALILLFWNASANNELLNYLNNKVYFPALYSGRVAIKNDEVTACIKDLKEMEADLKKWSDSTISTTASKYLTLLKKFGLMEGSRNKSLTYPYLPDSLFILFVYWLSAISEKPNLLYSDWLQYSFTEKQTFIERLLQKKFSPFFDVTYTGDKLSVETKIPYASIYERSIKS